MTRRDLPPDVLAPRPIVYVRQSTQVQVAENLESQRRQYELADLAREYGFRDVAVIDEDLGITASGTTDRPGIRNLVGHICEGAIGAVFCLKASRLARNGRDWHHLLELCALVHTRAVDTDGIYDPSAPNVRLLLGLKGTMSEFELTVLRRRLLEAAQAKARRGELRMPVPVGYVWPRDTGLMLDPDRRVQEAIRGVFRLFDRLGSAAGPRSGREGHPRDGGSLVRRGHRGHAQPNGVADWTRTGLERYPRRPVPSNNDGRGRGQSGRVVSRDPEVAPVRNLARAPGRLRCSLADFRSRSGPPGSPAGPTPMPTSLRPPAIRAMIEHSRFPALEEGAHNETNLTTPRRLLSVALLSMGTAGSSRNRSRPAATDQNGPHLRRRHRDPGLS